MGGFLDRVHVMDEVTAIVLYNDGIKLAVEGSPVRDNLRSLLEAGVDLLPCVTCLDYYGLELAVGSPSNMDEITGALDSAEKVITL